MNNYCPKCNADLGGKQECANCGPSSQEQSSVSVSGAAAILNSQSLLAISTSPQNNADGGAKDDAAIKEDPRHLKPATPEAAAEAVGKKSSDEKQQARSPQPQKRITPHAAARQDPGLPFLEKDLRDLGPVALRATQRGAQNTVIGSVELKTLIKRANIHFQDQENRTAPHTTVHTVSLMELAVKLPPREAQIPGKASYHVDQHVTKLRDQHVLFMSCADASVALGAAYALLEELEIDSEQRLLVNLARNPETSDSFIQLFTQPSVEDRQELTAIVIDGFNEEARKFLDWLRANTINAIDVRRYLRDNNFLLLCLVDPKYLQNYVSGNSPGEKFAIWPVPCLQPLLKHHFPEEADSLEREILAQQTLGKWKQSDVELCDEVRGLLDGDLRQIVEQRRTTPTASVASNVPEIVFKGDHSIEDTLFYVGTYFPDLAPHEFDQVVEWLLGDRTTTVTVKTQQYKADGTLQIVETEAQKPLRDFWNGNPDNYLESCQLDAVPESNGTVAIRFANEIYRETLKTHLERRHSVYLVRQFRALQSNGFLTSAPNISARARNLSIEMAKAYPGSFGKEWLLNIIVDARQAWETSAGSDKAVVNLGKSKALEQITLLVRLMLEHAPLQEVVDGVLKDLMSLGMHDTVLYLARGLQFAPGFDEFYWMKRLVDEGDEIIKITTYYHLYSYIKKIGIYSLLSKLEAWIPSDDRPLDTYPPSCVFSLRLLVEYCSEVTETFEKDRQTQPLHPLFTFVDEQAAKENCQRLVGWYFHPGMPSVFADLDSVFTDDTPEALVLPFICELILEWMFVLRKQEITALSTAGKENISESSATDDERFLDAERTRDALIDSLALIAAPAQRDYMLHYWERLRDFMGLIASLRDGSAGWFGTLDYKEKNAILSTRLLVRDLIKRFRIAIRNARLRPAKAVMTT